MTDMAATTAVKSDQINAADLLGGPITVTVVQVRIDLSSDQPVSMQLRETPKVFRPCKIMRRAIMEMWGNDANAYVGRSMTLYCDLNVRFGKDQPGGTRISHMSNIDGEKIITTMVSKGKFAPHRIRVLQAAKPDPRPGPTAAPTAADAFTQDEARTAARRGTEAFRAWFKDNADKRPEASQIMDELKGLCTAADNAMAADPFGLPPVSDPTPAQLAAAEAEALAAIAQAARERVDL